MGSHVSQVSQVSTTVSEDEGVGAMFAEAEAAVVACVEINQCVGCTPSSRPRVDGVEDDSMIQQRTRRKI